MSLESAISTTLKKQKEYELAARLERNLAFFEQYIPELHSKFRDYTPTSIALRYDESDEVNLKNYARNGEYVYQSSPITLCQNSVDNFIDQPHFRVVRAGASEVMDAEDDIHHDTTNRAIALLEAQPVVRQMQKGHYDFMILNGLGIGYVLNGLMEKTTINHLIIIEPSEDIFYAAMHVVDWHEVFSRFACTDFSKSLNLVIGEEDQETNVSILLDNHIKNMGIHHAVLPYVFNHLSSKSLDGMLEAFFKRMNFSLSAAGFSDDEIWSIAHTAENWSRGYPLLQLHAFTDKMSVDRPVFVLANGPSLDNSIEFIKANKDKAFIISCGSTLGSLMKMGLKPDIHVEMERRYLTCEWLEETTTPEFRKGITFIGLNTLHPGVFDLFDDCYMVMKPADLGSRYCNRFVDPDSGHKCVLLLNCNPTAGNMGVATASALGFKDVFLFGLDLSMSSDKTHHSKHSTYYDVDEDDEELLKMDLADESSSVIELDGNFRDKVKTSRLFMGAIVCNEATILDSTHQTYHNASDGAKIKGAIPTPFDKISLGDAFDKKLELKDLMARFFGRKGLIDLDDISVVSDDFVALEPSLLLFRRAFESPFESSEDVIERLDTQMRKVKDMDQLGANFSCIHYVLRGSIFYWNLLFMQGVYRGLNEKMSLQLVNEMRNIYLEYIDRTINKCRHSVLHIDDKTIGLNEMIND